MTSKRTSNARTLRSNMTPQEVKLWNHLRRKQWKGVKFRRQVQVDHFIVDFACFSCRLIIEVDGSQHGVGKGKRQDLQRDRYLIEQGFNVLRFWNNEVDQNIEGVLLEIEKHL